MNLNPSVDFTYKFKFGATKFDLFSTLSTDNIELLKKKGAKAFFILYYT